jgi:hypothetical protein
MTVGVLYMIYVSLQAENRGDLDIYKLCLRELGKNFSEICGWSHSITSPQSYEVLQPWPPPCSLGTSFLSGRGVVLWTLVHELQLEDELYLKRGRSVMASVSISYY